MRKTFGKKLLSGVMAALMSVSYAASAVPMFSKAATATIGSEAEAVTLLVGSERSLRQYSRRNHRKCSNYNH